MDLSLGSKSPTVALSGASFLARRQDFGPTNHWGDGDAIPRAHLVLSVFGYLIYNSVGSINNVYFPTN